MGKKLYVGNLSYSMDNTQLEEMFTKYGTVQSAEVIQDRDTGRSKGFGFVEMSDDNAARQAIEGVNGQENDGRTLTGHLRNGSFHLRNTPPCASSPSNPPATNRPPPSLK